MLRIRTYGLVALVVVLSACQWNWDALLSDANVGPDVSPTEASAGDAFPNDANTTTDVALDDPTSSDDTMSTLDGMNASDARDARDANTTTPDVSVAGPDARDVPLDDPTMGADGAAPGSCPATAPSGAGSPCTTPGLMCSYGAEAGLLTCRPRYQCTGGVWVTLAPDDCVPCSATGGAVVGGSSCAAQGEVCETTMHARCECVMGSTSTPQWQCGSAPLASCPPESPNLGDACGSGLASSCDYDTCHGGWVIVCVGGEWTLDSTSCP